MSFAMHTIMCAAAVNKIIALAALSKYGYYNAILMSSYDQGSSGWSDMMNSHEAEEIGAYGDSVN